MPSWHALMYGDRGESSKLMICCAVVLLPPPHYHNYADLSEGIELLNAWQIHSVSSVSRIKSIPTFIFHAIYGSVCIHLTHFSYDDCVNTCTLSYYHYHQIGSMTHLPLFRVRSWNNGVRCMSFYILMETIPSNVSGHAMLDLSLNIDLTILPCCILKNRWR